ncbi:MAG TPA: LuxR C-terminal-related transcriptional regulator [Anaerolineae bacterium]|nr:LuxR C-terminal-related transcriptional regulator [Anaerolineae bacterium]
MAGQPVEPLIQTKLFIPQARHEVVERPRLAARLDEGLRCALTLVSAPAGSGKTTALAAWAAKLGMPVAWLSLDKDDNDPTRFFAYLGAALRVVRPHAGEAVAAAFQSPHPPESEAVLAALVNEIAADASPFVLVLDDYHAIKGHAIHSAIAFLVEHMPAPLHLVVATRSDPPLPLGRLRGQMQLIELRAADLRFTAQEAAIFLSRVMGLTLAGEKVAALEARTEGWIVGLQLAALSMRGREDVAGFIAAFTGSHHYILDYLIEEVLQRQPTAVQTFLLHTSILDRLCGPLCDAVLGSGEGDGPRSQQMLEHLERNNLFIVPLDNERRWYRYHHLFADLLRQQLGRLHAGLVPELHRRAGLWHQGNGLTSEAIGHLLRAGEHDTAAALVEQEALSLLRRGELTTLSGWLEALPTVWVRGRPHLCLYQAWTLAMTGRLDEAELLLEDVERHQALQPGGVESLHGQVAAVRAWTASLKGEAVRALALAREALQQLPESDLLMRSMVHFSLNMVCLSTGNLGGAYQALTEGVRMARAAGNRHAAVSAIGSLGGYELVLGRLHQAAETFQTALRLGTGPDGRLLPIAARACHGLSELHYEWNDLDAAVRFAREGIDLAQQWGNAEAISRGPLALARALQGSGDLDGARAALERAEQAVRQHELSPWVPAQLAACRVRMWLAPRGGGLEALARWVEACRGALAAGAQLDYAREAEYLALARALIALRRNGEAMALLGRLRTGAEAGVRLGEVIEIRVLEAVALRAGGELGAALASLERALAPAEPEGYVRSFVDGGAPVAALLADLAADRRSSHAAYVRRLLAAFGLETGGQTEALAGLAETLSERELEVLRCMAAGLTNGEIAARLVVALSTVKTHINHIFAKLDVTTRTQALVKASELGLLKTSSPPMKPPQG